MFSKWWTNEIFYYFLKWLDYLYFLNGAHASSSLGLYFWVSPKGILYPYPQSHYFSLESYFYSFFTVQPKYCLIHKTPPSFTDVINVSLSCTSLLVWSSSTFWFSCFVTDCHWIDFLKNSHFCVAYFFSYSIIVIYFILQLIS